MKVILNNLYGYRRLWQMTQKGLVLLIFWPMFSIAQSPSSTVVNMAETARYDAQIKPIKTAQMLVLPLDAHVYQYSQTQDLTDVWVVDARGERVAASFMPPNVLMSSMTDAVKFFPLPTRLNTQQGINDIKIVHGELKITATQVPPVAQSPSGKSAPAGYVLDIPNNHPDAVISKITLNTVWEDAPQNFDVNYTLESSNNLQNWQSEGSGQLMRLMAHEHVLSNTQLQIPVERLYSESVRRYWRIWFDEPTQMPALKTVNLDLVVASEENQTMAVFRLSPEKLNSSSTTTTTSTPAEQILTFGLPNALPMSQLKLLTDNGVVPAEIYVKNSSDKTWYNLANIVFQGGDVSESAKNKLQFDQPTEPYQWIQLRVDARARRLNPSTTKLLVEVAIPRLLVVNEGKAPLSVLVGNAQVTQSQLLPIDKLMPNWAQKVSTFGTARLDTWRENAHVAREQVQQQQKIQTTQKIKPWLLWSILLLGVLFLGGMVWKLSVSAKAMKSSD